MATIDSACARGGRLVVLRPFGRRVITHAIHDVDGTHSLIREWQPVMSLCVEHAMFCGLGPDCDSETCFRGLIERVGSKALPEADRISREFAGYSALTQLEYGVRRALETGRSQGSGLALGRADARANRMVLDAMLAGRERCPEACERPEIDAFIRSITPRLFRLYERLLRAACRDRNTAAAWRNPEAWRVPGSLEFLRHLRSCGVVNHFVTGSVVSDSGGMREEIEACGFEVGTGCLVESLTGSTFDEKSPKDEVMDHIFCDRGVHPSETLVVGDGRTEIDAGVRRDCVTIGRVPARDEWLCALLAGLGVHLIVEDFTAPELFTMIRTP